MDDLVVRMSRLEYFKVVHTPGRVGRSPHKGFFRNNAHGTLTSVPESTYSKAEDNGSNFRIAGCRYHYNLPARALGIGTYRVDISINGIMVGHAVFALKSGRHEDDKDDD